MESFLRRCRTDRRPDRFPLRPFLGSPATRECGVLVVCRGVCREVSRPLAPRTTPLLSRTLPARVRATLRRPHLASLRSRLRAWRRLRERGVEVRSPALRRNRGRERRIQSIDTHEAVDTRADRDDDRAARRRAPCPMNADARATVLARASLRRHRRDHGIRTPWLAAHCLTSARVIELGRPGRGSFPASEGGPAAGVAAGAGAPLGGVPFVIFRCCTTTRGRAGAGAGAAAAWARAASAAFASAAAFSESCDDAASSGLSRAKRRNHRSISPLLCSSLANSDAGSATTYS